MTLFQLGDSTGSGYTEHSSALLEAVPSSLARHQEDKLAVVVGNLKLLIFEYGGGQGLRQVGTIHQGRAPTINTFIFVNTPANINNLLVTGNTNGKLKIFEALPNFEYSEVDIACRSET